MEVQNQVFVKLGLLDTHGDNRLDLQKHSVIKEIDFLLASVKISSTNTGVEVQLSEYHYCE